MMTEDPWKNRAKGMRCATCIFYVPKVPLTADGLLLSDHQRLAPPEIGRCRRHAPTMSGFPAVFPMDWCGDHRLDEAKT